MDKAKDVITSGAVLLVFEFFAVMALIAAWIIVKATVIDRPVETLAVLGSTVIVFAIVAVNGLVIVPLIRKQWP